MDGESHLYRVHPDGSGLEKFTDFSGAELRAAQPPCSADGKWIVFTAVSDAGRSLWAIPAAGGETVEIGTWRDLSPGTWQQTAD